MPRASSAIIPYHRQLPIAKSGAGKAMICRGGEGSMEALPASTASAPTILSHRRRRGNTQLNSEDGARSSPLAVSSRCFLQPPSPRFPLSRRNRRTLRVSGNRIRASCASLSPFLIDPTASFALFSHSLLSLSFGRENDYLHRQAPSRPDHPEKPAPTEAPCLVVPVPVPRPHL